MPLGRLLQNITTRATPRSPVCSCLSAANSRFALHQPYKTQGTCPGCSCSALAVQGSWGKPGQGPCTQSSPGSHVPSSCHHIWACAAPIGRVGPAPPPAQCLCHGQGSWGSFWKTEDECTLLRNLKGKGLLCKALLCVRGSGVSQEYWALQTYLEQADVTVWGHCCFPGCMRVAWWLWGGSTNLRKYPQINVACGHSPSTPRQIANYCLAMQQNIHSQNGNVMTVVWVLVSE